MLTIIDLLLIITFFTQLGRRQHFVDNSNMYTIQDLQDVHSGVLLKELQTVHLHFVDHIKFLCSVSFYKSSDIHYKYSFEQLNYVKLI